MYLSRLVFYVVRPCICQCAPSLYSISRGILHMATTASRDSCGKCNQYTLETERAAIGKYIYTWYVAYNDARFDIKASTTYE